MFWSPSSTCHWSYFTIGNLLILVFGIATECDPLTRRERSDPSQPQILVHIQLVDVDCDSLPMLEINPADINPADLSGDAVVARSVDDSIRIRLESLRKTETAERLMELELTATNGRTVTFFSGGEFPIPLPSEDGSKTVELIETGTRVDFLPTLLKNGRIRLAISREIVEVDDTLSVNFAGTSVPGLHVRQANGAGIDVANGETVVLAAFPLEPKRTKARVTLVVAKVEKVETR